MIATLAGALMTFELVVVWLIGMNALAAALFAWDKLQARRGGRRISERTLLSAAFLGGSPAALASQQLLRHKTSKEPFRTLLWGIAGLHGLSLLVLAIAALAPPVPG